MNAFRVSGSIVPTILNLGTRWRSAVRLIPSHFASGGKSFQYILNRRLMGCRVNPDVLEKRKISCPCWDLNLISTGT
jgi:hypothetical protein